MVMWSDETKINFFWSQMIGYVCDKMRERACMTFMKGTVKFESRHLIMEECMGWDGVGHTTKIDERIDGDFAIAILDFLMQIICLTYLIFVRISLKGPSSEVLESLEQC